jgi:putative BNR repeat neuraminidase
MRIPNIYSSLILVSSFILIALGAATSLAIEKPTLEMAVAYLNATRPLEHIPHPYPMFYHYHVAPHAVIKQGKIFFTYQDENGRPLAMSYDSAANTWKGPRRVSTSSLGRDTHGNPSLSIDRTGRLHIFFGAHGGPLQHVVSGQSLEIDDWEELTPPTTKATYPQSQLMADGTMALFLRAGGHTAPWTFRFSSDGQIWSDSNSIVDLRRNPQDSKAAAYCAMLPGQRGQSLHLFFVHKDDNASRVDPHPWRTLKYPGLNEAVYRYNLYYVRRNSDGDWVSSSGAPIELPITKRIADEKLLVYDSGDELTFCTAFAVDEEDRPYARFNVGVVDWAQGDRVVVPWRTLFASPSTTDGAGWRLAERLADIPDAVQNWLDPQVVPVYDGDNGGISPEWFLRHEVGVFEQNRGSNLFLAHVEHGWIQRDGGPAGPPQP